MNSIEKFFTMYYNMRSKRSLIMKKKFVISFIVAFLAFGFVFYRAQKRINNGELKGNDNIEENQVEEEAQEEEETEEELNPGNERTKIRHNDALQSKL